MKTKMKICLQLTCGLLLSLSLLAADNPAPGNLVIDSKTPFSIGETIEFSSQILQENRALNIYLPASYSSETKRHYPVIYLLDGSRDEDFVHIAGIAQFGGFSWINMMPEAIVVGIANVDRKRDFTYPTLNAKDKKDYPTTGSSEKFIRFLELEVKSLIEKSYRIEGDTTLVGQSLGGLLATQLLFQQPQLFNNYIIVSPSLWWDDESMLQQKIKDANFKGRIFIAVGKEGEVMERVAQQLYQKLGKELVDAANLQYHFYEKLDHGDTLHLAAYDAFSFVFSSRTPNAD